MRNYVAQTMLRSHVHIGDNQAQTYLLLTRLLENRNLWALSKISFLHSIIWAVACVMAAPKTITLQTGSFTKNPIDAISYLMNFWNFFLTNFCFLNFIFYFYFFVFAVTSMFLWH